MPLFVPLFLSQLRAVSRGTVRRSDITHACELVPACALCEFSQVARMFDEARWLAGDRGHAGFARARMHSTRWDRQGRQRGHAMG
jgi:hypothetical protein